MRTEDLKTLSQLGQSLWVKTDNSEKIAVETLTAVSLLQLAPEKTVERTSMILLERAMRDGVSAIAEGVHQPFYRLTPEERFILTTLHSGRWSYARLARLLDRKAEEIAQIAWNARVTLGAHIQAAYPAGAKSANVNCPEYNASNPWTQRFLDEEVTQRERLFFQNHMMACESCRQTLVRCRNLYYAVEKQIPRPANPEQRVEALQSILDRTYEFQAPSERTFAHSLKIFFGRSDVQWLMAGIVLMVWVLNR